VAVDESVARALVDAFGKELSSHGVLETGWVDYGGWDCGGLWERLEQTTHVIDIAPGFDDLWNTVVDRQRKKRTRRAERLGVTVRRAASDHDVESYYRIYSQRVDDWGGGIRYPKRLFTELLDRAGDAARLYVAEHDGKIVGGHFNFYFRKTVTAWNGMTTPESNHLQPGTLLYIHCLKDACAEGFEAYNLGGSLNKQSLIDFKESLGGISHTYSQYRRRSLLARLASRFRTSGR
jgi:CelD/BcsL family acetyltransferase involved in cellulose biosynthesis